jgi:hypothetical protein
MKTPAGKECKYYYADFHRGRDLQVCRLIEKNSDSPAWRPHLCHSCPVPDILRANGSETLTLDGKVVNKFLGLKQQVEVTGWCNVCFSEVPDPMRGCPNRDHHNRPSILDLDEAPE